MTAGVYMFMSEYVKIKRRLYDELIEDRAKYKALCVMMETMQKVYEENRPEKENDVDNSSL
jgi:hypothetical protein